MEEKLSALCEELCEAREARRELLGQLKMIEEMVSQLKNDVIHAMQELELEECVTGGYQYTVQTAYNIEKTCNNEEFVQLFRSNQRSDLITEYVNPRSLHTFVTEELQMHDELPKWILGSVLVKETNKLSIRKKK